MRCAAVTLLLLLFASSGCATTRTATKKGAAAAKKEKAAASKTAAKKEAVGKSATKNATADASKAEKTAEKKPKKKKKKASSSPDSSDVPETYKPRKEACEQYEALIREKAAQHELEAELVLGVVKVESNFNPECRSRVGATGLMQVMPRTGKHMECGSDLEDPETNVECGCRVLKRYIDLYDGNVIYGLAAYNAGPGNANPSAKESHLPFNFQYVEKVLRWRNVFVRFGCR